MRFKELIRFKPAAIVICQKLFVPSSLKRSLLPMLVLLFSSGYRSLPIHSQSGASFDHLSKNLKNGAEESILELDRLFPLPARLLAV